MPPAADDATPPPLCQERDGRCIPRQGRGIPEDQGRCIPRQGRCNSQDRGVPNGQGRAAPALKVKEIKIEFQK